MSYDVVLFDLDHTLLDSDASHAAAIDAALLPVLGQTTQPFDDIREAFTRINNALWRSVERGAVNPNEVKVLRFVQLLDELGIDGDPEHMGATFAGTLTTHGDLYPGARELLDRLAGKVQLGMVTNGIGVVQRGRLERLKISDLFEAVVISGEVGVSKPSPAIFDVVFEALGVGDRGSAVMVGDNLGSDIAGGVAAGIDTVWFNQHGVANETDVVAQHEVRSIAELAALLVPTD